MLKKTNISVACGIVTLWMVLIVGCEPQAPTLILAWSPPEAVVSIDGFVPEKAVSPHSFTFFHAGRYLLKVESAGFKPVEMYVDLVAGQTLKETVHLAPVVDSRNAMPPEPSPGNLLQKNVPVEPTIADSPVSSANCRISISTNPSGAPVFIEVPGGADAQAIGKTPVEIDSVRDSAIWISVEMPGYRRERRLIPPAGDNCPGNVHIALSREERLQPSSEPLSPVTGPIVPTALLEPIRPDDREMTGRLFLTTNLVAAVFVDGRSIGNTPIAGYPVEAGRRTILIENRDLQKRRVKIVNVQPGEHVRLAEVL